jgi:hypothetical protein
MTGQWTPAPWMTGSRDRVEAATVVAGPGNRFVADCNKGLPGDVAIANAHLIAAAPDLYDALASIENDDGSIPAAIWAARNAALKKARGET